MVLSVEPLSKMRTSAKSCVESRVAPIVFSLFFAKMQTEIIGGNSFIQKDFTGSPQKIQLRVYSILYSSEDSIMRYALTYDDVALVPQYNNISSRTKPILESWLTKKLKVGMPLLASNMDTVIGDELADILIA